MHIEHVKLVEQGPLYAVRALDYDIAFYNDGPSDPGQGHRHERQHIPPRFLEQIFQDLKRSHGIVGLQARAARRLQLVAPPGGHPA